MKRALLLALLLAGAVPAQGEAALAHSLLQAMAPAVDDPDASVQQLVATALQHGDSPAACLLLEEALRRNGDLQQPHLVLQMLQRRSRSNHGLAELRAQELVLRLQYATGAIAADPACRLPMPVNDPFAHHASSVLAIGPFGDDGDFWTGVSFPPELEFPATGKELNGRNGPVTARVVERRPFARRLSLAQPARPGPGCYYALHRVRAAAAQPCLLEVESDSALQVFVNGREVGRIDPMLDMGPQLRWLPAVLAAGTNHVLLKTCSNGRSDVSLRYVDQRLRPQAGLVEVTARVALAPPPVPAGEGAPTPPPDVMAVLQQAAAMARGVEQEQLLVAAAHAAERRAATALLLRLLATSAAQPPQGPLARLGLALVVRATEQWPEEQRNATGWALEEATLQGLGERHHAAVMARVRQLEQQDRAEEGLRLLRVRIDQGRAGPVTCDAAFRIAQRLRFDGEQALLLAAWTKACPGDPRPLLLLARRAAEDGDGKAALALCCRALARRPGDQPVLQAAFDLCQECGGPELGRALLSLMFPPRLRPGEPLALATARLGLARSEADRRRELAAVVAHPDADVATLRRAGERLLQLGDAAGAAVAWRQSLALEPDQPSLRELLARAGKEALPQQDLERFRRDAAAVLAGFKAGERERTASTTMLLDQMIVEVLPDGSRMEEVHQLRRINDQEGVEAMREAHEAAAADELLLLRTIGVDGKSYVPLRVGRTLAMPKLEPGAFIEWRCRNHARSPGPGPWQGPRFSFRSADEPYLLSELVLVLPAEGRGEVRTHEFTGTPERVPLDGNRQALVFRMQDQPRLPDEQRAPPEPELVPAAGYGQDAVPAGRLRSASVAIRARSRPEPMVHDLAARLLQDRTTDGARVAAIADFCDHEIESGPSENPTSTLLRKKGDRFTLQLALLAAAGFTVQPGLCADEREAPMSGVGELFADVDQLSVACARILLKEGALLWLFRDSARYWPTGAVPGSRTGARALLDVAGAPELTRVPGPESAVGRVLVVRGKAQLDAEGMVVLRCRVEIGDVAGFEIADRLRQSTASERELAARQMSQGLFQGWRVRSAAVVIEPRSPLRLDAELQRRLLQPGSEGRSLLPLPMPPGQFVAQFGDRSERQLPLCIDEEAAFDWQLEFDPGPFRPAQLPPPVLEQHGTLDYSLQWTQQGEGLQLRRRVNLRACRIPVAGFAAWMRTLEQIDRAEQQNLTLVRR